MSIYKPCDIRGLAASELSAELYQAWGAALGQLLGPQAKFVVGGDVRPSTPAFLDALAQGLVQAGVEVVDLGIQPTPLVYYARRRLQADGCAVVTAACHPAEFNGLKWMIGDQLPTPDEVQALQQAVARAEDSAAGAKPARSPSSKTQGGRKPGSLRPLDVSFDYVAWLQETWIDAMNVELQVVLDPMHGSLARRARRYLQAIFPRCLFSAIRDEPDATFAGLTPDCARPDLLGPLSQAVEHARADLGIAFDGDGGRVAFVDGAGMPLSPEETTAIFLQSFAAEAAGQAIVYDLKFSQRVPELARQLQAEPLVERSGQAFVRRRMRQSQAVFGAEVSGHYFFRALDGGDDGLFAACWLIGWLAHSRQSLAELRQACPPVFMTPDLRVACAADQQPQVLEAVQAAWKQYPQSTLDGVRVEFPEGWALVRPSLNEPALTFRFEARDWRSLRNLVWRYSDALAELGDELWMQYAAAMGESSAGQACGR